jgi:hypothetical protein
MIMTDNTITEVISKAFETSMDYVQYRTMIDELLGEGKTTGLNQSEEMVGYTNMNQVRMKRLDKTTKIRSDLEATVKGINKETNLLIITEAWCGDAAQIIPVVHGLAEMNELVYDSYVLRDENPDLMDQFLTNGSRSIPIIIIIDRTSGEVLGSWGPRPAEMQQMVMDRKNDPSAPPYSEFAKTAQLWYAREKTLSIQQEFGDALRNATQSR